MIEATNSTPIICERTLSGTDDTIHPSVPILDEAISADAVDIPVLLDTEEPQPPALTEAQLALVQAELTSLTRELTDRLLDGAMRDMEATLFDKVSNRLREELPELIDRVLREHLEPRD